MKYTELLESELLTDKDEIIKWLNLSSHSFKSDKLTIEPDGLIYDGNLLLKTHVEKIKVQFKLITGGFYCRNTLVTSLKYCPSSVNRSFYCYNNNIIDPKEYRYALYCEIGGTFESRNERIDEIINMYGGPSNRKYWALAIAELGRVKL